MKMSRLIAIVFCFLIPGFVNAEVIDRIVAIVNTDVITDSDLRSFQSKMDRPGFIDETLLMGKSAESLKTSRQDRLNYLINQSLISSEIRRLNLSVTNERVEQEIRDIARQNGVSRPDLLSAIKAQGLSVSDYQAFIKARIEKQSLLESEISSKIRVSEEDVRAEFQRLNPKVTSGVVEYSLSQIYFNPRKSGPAEARSRADQVLARIKSGEKFEALAEQTSEDPNFSNGGVLGNFKSGELSPEMEKAVATLEVGGVSEVVQTRQGFHILKLTDKKMVNSPQFLKQMEPVRSQLFERAFKKHLRIWLENKRQEAFIRINAPST